MFAGLIWGLESQEVTPGVTGFKVVAADDFFPYFLFSNIPPSHALRPRHYPFNSELISCPTNIICPAQKWQRGRTDQNEWKQSNSV
ncbi:uncharacterized [Tachysurus ichikawai]